MSLQDKPLTSAVLKPENCQSELELEEEGVRAASRVEGWERQVLGWVYLYRPKSPAEVAFPCDHVFLT